MSNAHSNGGAVIGARLLGCDREKQFELVFAFDEVLTFGGYRESITLAQINTNLGMESHEEKLHKMIQQSKETQAKEEADRKAKAFREEKRAAKMAGLGGGAVASGGMLGMGGGSASDGSPAKFGLGSGSGGSPFLDRDAPGVPPSSSFGDYGVGGQAAPQALPGAAERAPAPKKGMSLALGGSKKVSQMDKLAMEDNLQPLAPASAKGGASGQAAAELAAPAAQEALYPVMLTLEEKVSASLNREGALEQMEVKGTMNLTATEDSALNCKVVLAPGGKNPNFAFQTHPKVDKKAYETQGTLALKAGAFPKHKSVGVLRWSMSTAAEDQVPISINCWPEPDGGTMNVNVEYTADKPGVELHDVRIAIPLGTAANVDVLTCDSGTHKHHRGAEQLVWELSMVDASNKTASLEFNVAQKDADAFFPILVSFRSVQLHAGVAVAGVVHAETGQPLQYGCQTSVTTETYKVE
jgi:hypothetical protein